MGVSDESVCIVSVLNTSWSAKGRVSWYRWDAVESNKSIQSANYIRMQQCDEQLLSLVRQWRGNDHWQTWNCSRGARQKRRKTGSKWRNSPPPWPKCWRGGSAERPAELLSSIPTTSNTCAACSTTKTKTCKRNQVKRLRQRRKLHGISAREQANTMTAAIERLLAPPEERAVDLTWHVSDRCMSLKSHLIACLPSGVDRDWPAGEHVDIFALKHLKLCFNLYCVSV